MTTTVHVSRTFSVDPSNPQVLEELRSLAARGFEVLGPLDLTPVSATAKKSQPSGGRVAEIMKELATARGLGGVSVAALIGVSDPSLYNWKNGRSPIPASRLAQLEKLLRRSRSLPENSTALRDEARGALAASRRLAAAGKQRSGRGGHNATSDEKKLEVAVMREGGAKVRDIAKAVGVSPATVCRIVKDLGVK